MIPIAKKSENPWVVSERTRPESFWASYSDLMAGLLMVFALTTVITLVDIGDRLLKPTQVVKEWEKVLDDICHDQDLARMDNVRIDCSTGALIISDENLRFGFSRTELGQEAEQVLRQAVPKYLEIIHRYPKFLDHIEVIEISGHTDRKDARGANPSISRDRAGRTLEFLFEEPAMAPYVNLLREKAITAGYSDTRYPIECQQRVVCAAARRVEIAVHLEYRDVLEEFLDILKQVIGKHDN